jgi:hypothetical protein
MPASIGMPILKKKRGLHARWYVSPRSDVIISTLHGTEWNLDPDCQIQPAYEIRAR